MKTTRFFEESYKFRIGNIELRKTSSIFKKEKYMEIVRYFPNTYYGRENEFIYDEDKEWYYHKDVPNIHIHKDIFNHKETCCTIAFVEQDYTEEPDITSVGSRPYNLPDEEFINYKKVLNHLYNTINKKQS